MHLILVAITMKYILAFFLLTQISFAQEIKSPRVLILTPLEFVLDEHLSKESKQYETTLTDEQVEECISERNTDEDRDFVKKMNQAECKFAQNSDISTAFTHYLYGWLTFKLYGTFDDAIIYPAKGPEQRGLEQYNTLSNEHDVNWIVDIRSVDLKKESERLMGTVTLQLWNKNTNEITLTTQIEVDDNNYGGEMSCEDGTIGCLFVNGVVYMSQDILKSMYSDEKYWR